MTKIITLTTSSDSYLIDIGLDSPVYYEILSPIFDQLGVQAKSISLDDEKLVTFKNQLERALENYIQHYQPGRGRGREKKIFGKNYFLTLLNPEHNAIALLNNVYIATVDCVQNDITLRFEYSE